MNVPTVALLGAGVEARAELLSASLDPRWRVMLASAAPSDLSAATAAIGMPGAADWCASFPHLQLLQLPGAGLDGLDWERVPSECRVCNVYEHEASVAEYIFATLLQRTSTWLNPSNAALASGTWMYFDRIGGGPRPSLCGRSLGIIGFGRIGRRCARIASALDIDVAVHRTGSAPVTPDDEELRNYRVVDDLADLAARVDILIVACRLTPQTRGLVDRRVLNRMGPEAILVNAARADIVDEEALFDMLSKQRIGGAILDVWYRYPQSTVERITGSRFDFASLPHVIVTPHLAANTTHMVVRRYQLMARNLNCFLDGVPLQNIVERSRAPQPL